MKTTRETKWKLAAAGLVLGLAALAGQVWRTHSDGRYYGELARQSEAQMAQQAQGVCSSIAAQTIPVPCLLPSGLI